MKEEKAMSEKERNLDVLLLEADREAGLYPPAVGAFLYVTKDEAEKIFELTRSASEGEGSSKDVFWETFGYDADVDAFDGSMRMILVEKVERRFELLPQPRDFTAESIASLAHEMARYGKDDVGAPGPHVTLAMEFAAKLVVAQDEEVAPTEGYKEMRRRLEVYADRMRLAMEEEKRGSMSVGKVMTS